MSNYRIGSDAPAIADTKADQEEGKGAQDELPAAACVVIMVPGILLFVALRRYFVEGMVQGAMKGRRREQETTNARSETDKPAATHVTTYARVLLPELFPCRTVNRGF